MNYLAHSFLSFSYDEILIGNFIADSLRGKEVESFHSSIKMGIQLHRLIDNFTDHHEIVKQSKERLEPKYGKYDSVIMDILYDHFLAINWNKYTDMTLTHHSEKVYQSLQNNYNILPPKIKEFLPHMIRENWLVQYGNEDGIAQSLRGMARRASFVSHMEEAVVDLKNKYSEFDSDFQLFFPELISVCKNFLEQTQKA